MMLLAFFLGAAALAGASPIFQSLTPLNGEDVYGFYVPLQVFDQYGNTFEGLKQESKYDILNLIQQLYGSRLPYSSYISENKLDYPFTYGLGNSQSNEPSSIYQPYILSPVDQTFSDGLEALLSGRIRPNIPEFSQQVSRAQEISNRQPYGLQEQTSRNLFYPQQTTNRGSPSISLNANTIILTDGLNILKN